MTVNQRETATLTVEASGSGTLSYQWYERGIDIFDNNPISGATAVSYNAPTLATGSRTYFCVITNTDETATGVKTASENTSLATVTVNRYSAGSTDITASFRDPGFLSAVRDSIRVYDGPIYASDVEAITYMNVSNKNISDLSGIEHFRDLERLWCDNNKLTDINLSKNPVLNEIHCRRNLLTELDVSGYAALKALYCENNRLKRLDLSKNAALTVIQCDGNQLTELNLPESAAMAIIRCQDNWLTELKIPNNAVSSVYWLNCSNNRMKDPADVAGFPVDLWENVYYTFYPQRPTVTVTGQVRSYNPQRKTTIALYAAGTDNLVASTTIDASPVGSGPVIQKFKLERVPEGVFDLVVGKETHLNCTITGITVGKADLDLTLNPDENISTISLPCGDIDGNGYINSADLSIIILLANYNRSVSSGANPRADLVGAGVVDSYSLSILILPANYNKTHISIAF
jgi:hypothetical protein